MAGKFHDLGEEPRFDEAPRESKPKKHFPRAHLPMKIEGLTKVGQTVRLDIEARVVGLEEREGGRKETIIELRKLRKRGSQKD